MNEEIVIVSAFFDIGRGHYTTFQRTNEKYFEYFEFWSKIKNELIVYCEPENVKKIKQIRGEELNDKTKIIPVDIYSIEPDILRRMKQVEADEKFHTFRHHEKDPSNTALYDYIMLLKWWCIQDAATKVSGDCILAWVDFGFNHGGSKYVNPKDFEFLWEWDYPKKVNAFCLNDPNDVSLIDSLQFQFDCFTGNFTVPRTMATECYSYMKEAMNALLDVGCIDDDQHMMLMVYKKYPDIFNIQIANWFDMFEINSYQTFETRTYSTPKFTIRIYNKLKRIMNKLQSRLIKSNFIRRMEKNEREHYN